MTWILKQSVVVKRELSLKAKLSIYRSIYVPTVTYGLELWVVTKRMRLRIPMAEKSFLCRVAGLSLRDSVRSSDILDWLRVERLLLYVERSQLRWFRHLQRLQTISFFDLTGQQLQHPSTHKGQWKGKMLLTCATTQDTSGSKLSFKPLFSYRNI